MSQTAIVARLLQLAQIDASATVLDVGSGSGYQAALLSKLCAHVYGVELVPELAKRARDALQEAGVTNVTVYTGDGFQGVPQHAPYDKSLWPPSRPTSRKRSAISSRIAGRLIIPVGPALSKRSMFLRALALRPSPQRFVRIVRRGSDFVREELDLVFFVSLVEANTAT